MECMHGAFETRLSWNDEPLSACFSVFPRSMGSGSCISIGRRSGTEQRTHERTSVPWSGDGMFQVEAPFPRPIQVHIQRRSGIGV